MNIRTYVHGTYMRAHTPLSHKHVLTHHTHMHTHTFIHTRTPTHTQTRVCFRGQCGGKWCLRDINKQPEHLVGRTNAHTTHIHIYTHHTPTQTHTTHHTHTHTHTHTHHIPHRNTLGCRNAEEENQTTRAHGHTHIRTQRTHTHTHTRTHMRARARTGGGHSRRRRRGHSQRSSCQSRAVGSYYPTELSQGSHAHAQARAADIGAP
jgi:hypothetical protein